MFIYAISGFRKFEIKLNFQIRKILWKYFLSLKILKKSQNKLFQIQLKLATNCPRVYSLLPKEFSSKVFNKIVMTDLQFLRNR